MVSPDEFRNTNFLAPPMHLSPPTTYSATATELQANVLPHYKVLLIGGGRRSGKTTLLRQLMRKIESNEEHCFWISIQNPVPLDQLKSLCSLAVEQAHYLVIDNLDQIQELQEACLFFSKDSRPLKIIATLTTPSNKLGKVPENAFLYECHIDPKEQSYCNQKAKIRDYLNHGAKLEAATVFSEIADEMVKHGDFADITELSEAIWKDLEWNGILARQKALAYAKRPKQCIEELEFCLTQTKWSAEHFAILLQLSKHYQTISELETATKYLDEILSRLSEGDEVYIQALLEKAQCCPGTAGNSSLELLESAKIGIDTYHTGNNRLIAEWHFVFGLIDYRRGELVTSLQHYKSAEGLFHKLEMLSDELMTALNAAILNYSNAQITVAINELIRIEELSAKYSMPYIVAFCRRLLTAHLIHQGKISLALNKIAGFLPKQIAPKLSENEIYLLHFRVLIELNRRNFSEAKEILHLLTAPNNIELDLVYGKIHQTILKLINAFTGTKTAELNDLILEIRQMPITDNLKMFLQIVILEQNYLNLFPFDLNSQMDKLQFNSPQKVDLDHFVRHKILRSIHLFLYGKTKLAQVELEKWAQVAQKVGYPLWEFRAYLWLSAIDLHSQQPHLAQSKLKHAETLISQFDPTWEIDFHLVLKSIMYLQFGKRDQFEESILNISASSPFSYFQNVLSKFINTKDARKTYPLEPRIKNVLDDLICKLNIESLKIFTVRNRFSEKRYYGHELPDFTSKKIDLILDEVKNEITIKGKKIAIGSHPLIRDLIQYLLSRIGEICSKEEIITHVWREKYNPLVHDPRIYTCVMRMKNMLGRAATEKIFRVVDGCGYGISDKIHYFIISEYDTEGFSKRQKWILNYLNTNSSISRLSVEGLLRISPAMAKRELKDLADRGRIEAFGTGKNTEYRKPIPL